LNKSISRLRREIFLYACKTEALIGAVFFNH
jgi:hypothetical protein